MTTIDEIEMAADAALIFRIAADVERWPDFLPHYRRVRVLERSGEELSVEMAALRGRIPVRWQAVQTLDPAQRRIYYRHTGGATKGMSVVWQIDPIETGSHVSIVHELTLQQPIVRTVPGQIVVGRFFISYIAGRTLHCMKDYVERGGRL